MCYQKPWLKKRASQLAALILFLLAGSGLAFGQQQAIDRGEQSITIALTDEPPTVNTLQATDQISFMVIDHITEGLMTYDQQNNLVGGVAERWQLRNDGATFWLRQDARWSDGKPVTAHDFVYAWRQALAPKNASEYAFILYPLLNAEAINQGVLPVEELGVEAVNDYQLEVSFKQPTAYFLDLTAFITYRPIRQDAVERFGREYGADPDKMLFNGPFTLTHWVHGASLQLKKNPRYWNREVVKLETINVPYMTSDSNSLYNLFKDEKIAMYVISGLNADTIKQALSDHMPMKKFKDGSVFYMEYNHRIGRITANHHLRKAIQLVFDQQLFTNKVVASPGNTASYSLFPHWLKGVDQPFHIEHPPKKVMPDIAKAKEHLAKAKQQLGVDKIPPLVLLITDTPGANKQAEYFQSLVARTLGLEIKIDKQIFKQRLAKMSSGEFDLVGAGWGPDYNDAMTFGELFASWNRNNRGRYDNPEYDSWVRAAQGTTDPTIRAAAFAEQQRILIEDAVILNQYQRGYVYLQHSELSGVVRRIFGGDPSFKYADIKDFEGVK
ncbi:Oligopeptide-binding protein OppA [Sinobacterium norvegicum]|uniref:Oligopeptide-binding protein OppA n=1 Tax=Sinobacterium norvegicum TaxID=1641715 RepID=A0ABN8EEM6_9GAMM|nr:peptide ABC transporter substrate-binding protein [Sinobacterium norvegicum]CAH0990846.1 Oligopeptide-binding protein OppA [Sinobacterium norvegicum]